MRSFETLRRIQILAEQGADGERERARERLRALLEAYKLTEKDLTRTRRTRRRFIFFNQHEFILLFYIVAMVLDDWQPQYSFPPAKKNKKQEEAVEFDLTDAEAVEINFLYTEYREALAKQIDEFVIAFLVKNEIRPPTNQNIDAAEIEHRQSNWRAARFANSIEKVSINRRLLTEGIKD